MFGDNFVVLSMCGVVNKSQMAKKMKRKMRSECQLYSLHGIMHWCRCRLSLKLGTVSPRIGEMEFAMCCVLFTVFSVVHPGAEQ